MKTEKTHHGRSILYGILCLLLTGLLLPGCSKDDDPSLPAAQGYMKATVDGEEVYMPYLAKMEEKEQKTWNLNALTEGNGNSLAGRKSMTINIRDAQGDLKAKTYKLDDGSCQMSATYTMYLDDKPTTNHWTASTGSALTEDNFTFTITSMENGIAKGTFSGTLRVSSSGSGLKTFREITKGEFSLPFGK